MKHGMTIEYVKCRADLNFEVDFGVNGAIGAIVHLCHYFDVTKISLERWIIYIYIYIYIKGYIRKSYVIVYFFPFFTTTDTVIQSCNA